MRRLAYLTLALPALVVAPPAGAQQTVRIDFREYASPVTTEHSASIGIPVSSQGLDFIVAEEFAPAPGGRNALGTWGSSPADPGFVNRPLNIGSSTSLFATAAGVGEEIDIFGSGSDLVLGSFIPFSVSSIDVGHLYSQSFSGISLSSFTLTFFGFGPTTGGMIQQAFIIAAPPVGPSGFQDPLLQTLTFDNRWQNLQNVWWFNTTAAQTRHQFTNVVATVIPEPGTYLLVLTGLGGLGLVGVRRRRVAA
jgi:hypothetical protein